MRSMETGVFHPLRRAIIIFLIGFICVSSGEGCRNEKPWPKPPPGPPKDVTRVIFLLLDAARADHFGTYGYKLNTTPEMDKIAKEGTVFENHFSQNFATSGSLPQMMTGRYFAQGVIASLSEYPDTRMDYSFVARDPTEVLLPDLLRKAGWKTVCFSAHMRITEDSPMGRSFSEHHLIKNKKDPYPRADKVIPEVQRWLIKNRDQHFFMYIHLKDTHFPHTLKEEHKEFTDPNYNWQKSFKASGNPKKPETNPWDQPTYIGNISDPNFYAHLNALYDGDLKHADKWVGKLWSTVRELGIEKNTLFIITADHGENLGEHGWYSHGGTGAWDANFHVPMIMVWPGKIPANERVRSFTEHVDLLPTLAELLGAPIPDGKTVDGKSFMPLIKDPNAQIRDFACGAFRLNRYIRTDQWMAGDLGVNGKFLYDVKQDPAETKNLADVKPEMLQELIGKVKAEVEESYRKWKALPFLKPTSTFEVLVRDMELNPRVTDLEGDDVLKIPPGEWALKRPYLIGHGGNSNSSPLLLTASVPSGAYTADLECTQSFKPFPGRASIFFAALGVPPSMREFDNGNQLSWWERFFPSKHKNWWETVYVPIGIAEAANNELKISIKTTPDASSWVIVRSVRLTPVGKKVSELSEEDRKKLKALGYIQ